MPETIYILRSTTLAGQTMETRCCYTQKYAGKMHELLQTHNDGTNTQTRKLKGPFQYAIWIEGLQNAEKVKDILDHAGHNTSFNQHIEAAKKQITDENFPTHTEAKCGKLILALIKSFKEEEESPEGVTVHLIQPLPTEFLFDISKYCKLNLMTDQCSWAKSPRPVKIYTEAQKAAIEKNKKRKGLDEKSMAPPTTTSEDVDPTESLMAVSRLLKDVADTIREPSTNLTAIRNELATHVATGAKLVDQVICRHPYKRQKTC